MTAQEQQLFLAQQAKQRKIDELEVEMEQAQGHDKIKYRNKIRAMNRPKKVLPTFGEYHANSDIERRRAMRKEGDRVYYQPMMSKEEAGWYYNKKLRTYWLNGLTDFPYHVRNKVLDYLLGGSR